MVKTLNIFELNDELLEQGPYSWIVADGHGLFAQFKELVLEILKYQKCKKLSLCKEISNRLRCSKDLLNDVLRRKSKWIHLKLIEDLLLILKNFDMKKSEEYKKSITDKIRWLKSYSRTQQQIKVVKQLDENLSKFCGAHAADGTLGMELTISHPNKNSIENIREKIELVFPQLKISNIYYRRNNYSFSFNIIESNKFKIVNFLKYNKIKFQAGYRFSLTDGHEGNLVLLKKLINNLFGISSKIRCEGNKYTIIVSNKIVARYLNILLGFPIGKKSDTVKPPELIENASFKLKQAFCKGVLQFDGSVRAKGTIGFSTNSKSLFNFIIGCVIKDGIKVNTWIRDKTQCNFESKPSKKWLCYFSKNTSKYNRLYDWVYGSSIKVDTFEEAVYHLSRAYPQNTNSKTDIITILKLIKNLKGFNRYQIISELKIHYKTLEPLINILLKNNILKIQRCKKIDRIKGISDNLWFNENINEWKISRSFVY